MGDLEVTEEGSLTVRTEMEPLGELTISTHGRGPLVSGSVQVLSDGPIGGVLRFDLPGVGVAGVGASQPLRDAIFPVRRQEGGIDTGMALRNLGESELVLTCRLMKYGAVLEEEEIPLAANGQVARFIGEVFTGTDTSDFVGSVRCTAPGEEMFTGLVLELDVRQPHLHDAAGGARGREDVSGIESLSDCWATACRCSRSHRITLRAGTAVVPVEPSPGSARLDDWTTRYKPFPSACLPGAAIRTKDADRAFVLLNLQKNGESPGMRRATIVRGDLLRAGRHGESDQRTAVGSVRGPDVDPEAGGESTAVVFLGIRLPDDGDVATGGAGGDEAGAGAELDPAGEIAEDRGAGPGHHPQGLVVLFRGLPV